MGEAILNAVQKTPVVRKLITTQFRLKAFVCVAVLKTISIPAREFGIQSIVEPVESGNIFTAIRQIGIDCARGHHVGRPSPELKGNDDS